MFIVILLIYDFFVLGELKMYICLVEENFKIIIIYWVILMFVEIYNSV